MHVHVCRVGLTVGQGGLPQKASILNFRPNSPPPPNIFFLFKKKLVYESI